MDDDSIPGTSIAVSEVDGVESMDLFRRVMMSVSDSSAEACEALYDHVGRDSKWMRVVGYMLDGAPTVMALALVGLTSKEFSARAPERVKEAVYMAQWYKDRNRLRKIERAADGDWKAAAWLLERDPDSKKVYNPEREGDGRGGSPVVNNVIHMGAVKTLWEAAKEYEQLGGATGDVAKESLAICDERIAGGAGVMAEGGVERDSADGSNSDKVGEGGGEKYVSELADIMVSEHKD